MKNLLILLFIPFVLSCSKDESETLRMAAEDRYVIISVREKQFNDIDFDFVLNNEVIPNPYGEGKARSSYNHEGEIPASSAFVINTAATASFEYDVYVRAKDGETATREFNGVGYWLYNDHDNYESPLIQPGQVITISL